MLFTPLQSNIFNLGFQISPFQFIAVINMNTGEILDKPNINIFNQAQIIYVDNFKSDIQQDSQAEKLYAGEKSISSTYAIDNRKIRLNFSTVVSSPYYGWIDPTIALLYESCNYSYLGSSTSYLTFLNNTSLGVGNTILQATNIEEFLNLTMPVDLRISDNTSSESVTLNSIDYTNKTMFVTGLTNSYNVDSVYVYYNPPLPSGIKEPALAIICNEGLIYPCYVNKMNWSFDAKDLIKVDIEIVGLFIDRSYQIGLLQNLAGLKKAVGVSLNYRPIPGFFSKIQDTTGISTNVFGLTQPFEFEMIQGLQNLSLNYTMIDSIKLNIQNNLEEVWAHPDLYKTNTQYHSNYFPFGVYSKGRVIDGSIQTKTHINPLSIIEKLASVGFYNQGLEINAGTFKIKLPELAFKLSNTNNFDSRDINFKVLSNQPLLPVLEYNNWLGTI